MAINIARLIPPPYRYQAWVWTLLRLTAGILGTAACITIVVAWIVGGPTGIILAVAAGIILVPAGAVSTYK